MCAKNSFWKFVAMLCSAFAIAATSLGAAAGDMHHHAHGVAAGTLDGDAGVRWATDAALRSGMAQIRTALEPAQQRIHEDKLPPRQYDALAATVSQAVAAIVANCKLEPQADAQLHVIIADMLDGVEAMLGKAPKVKRQLGALKVLDALDKYAAHFDHPGWQPLAD